MKKHFIKMNKRYQMRTIKSMLMNQKSFKKIRKILKLIFMNNQTLQGNKQNLMFNKNCKNKIKKIS